MKVIDRDWNEFKVESIFEVYNLKAYHKKSLISTNDKTKSIPYISRTNRNNGLEDIVEMQDDFKVNNSNTIVFGAENATFFYQPFEHISGNKMYALHSDKINKYSGLFLQQTLNSSVLNCGFGYGQGLTGTREKKRSIMLPVEKLDNKNPDWSFIEEYLKSIYIKKLTQWSSYANNALKDIKYVKIEKLKDKEWREFFLTELFPSIQRGKRLTKNNQISGSVPYISSTALNNGVDNFISNNEKVRNFEDCITIANSGSVGATFYHRYSFIASDHVTHLKNDNMNMYVYLFITTLLNRLSEKYNFNREINDKRISREKIILPIDDLGKPDYNYMTQYIKNMMFKKHKAYLKN